MDCCIDQLYGEKSTYPVTRTKCFPSWTSECRSAYHFLHSITYKNHSLIANEAFFQSLLLNVSLQECQPVPNITAPLYSKWDTMIWFAGSLIYFSIQIIIILVFKWFHWIFFLGCFSWHEPPLPLQALVFLLSLYSSCNNFSMTTLSLAAPRSQESFSTHWFHLLPSLPLPFKFYL